MATQPKKPIGGAFGQYLKENRPALTKECEGKPVTAITKLAGEKFRALDESAKEKYKKMNEEALKQYETELNAFLAGGGEVEKKKKKDKKMKDGKKKKAEKDPNRPTKPAGGGYGCYLAKNRQAFMKELEGKPGNPCTMVAGLAGERWKKMSESEKQPFEKEYQEKKAKYEEAMKSYVPPPGAAGTDAQEETPKKGRGAAKAAKTPKSEPKTKASAPKRKAEGKAVPRAKKAATKGQESVEVSIDETVLAEARKIQMESALMNLARRKEIVEKGIVARTMLEALKASGGLVNKAKDAILA